ncbi:MAG: hypothetical protein ABIJ48_01020 [Actinomycetota bacterium]
MGRGTAGPQSDIDLRVDVEEGTSLLDLATSHVELEGLLAFPIERVTDVKPRRRERVHAEAIAPGVAIETPCSTSSN